MTTRDRQETLHVAVGVIRNSNDEILIAKRSSNQHQGGKWEFPGGKVEAGENVSSALARELQEELGITIRDDYPLCQIHHHYPDRHVFLDVREVTAFSGKPEGLEGQPLKWQAPETMNPALFPAANQKIVSAVRLPRHIAIINDSTSAKQNWSALHASLTALPPMSWLRLRVMSDSDLTQYTARTKSLLTDPDRSKPLLVDLDNDLKIVEEMESLREEVQALQLPGWGYYANRHTLASLPDQRDSLLENKIIGASCHDDDEYQQAVEKQLDFVIASPVLNSASHPENRGMGWAAFSGLAQQGLLPCFAMGGLNQNDFDQARRSGAYGIAGINLYR